MAKELLTTITILSISLALAFTSGCESCAQSGSAIGALFGAGIGQMIGGDTESTIAGAAIGGATGYMLGNEEDKRIDRAERACIREEVRYVTINITNSNGSISKVRLRRYGVGYIGTRGEFYRSLPTEKQLRPVYGF